MALGKKRVVALELDPAFKIPKRTTTNTFQKRQTLRYDDVESAFPSKLFLCDTRRRLVHLFASVMQCFRESNLVGWSQKDVKLVTSKTHAVFQFGVIALELDRAF